MSQADDIRKYVIVNHISPARSRGDAQVSVRAGDVHREMDLSNSMPAVCSAIGSTKFWAEAGVRETKRDGPANSSTVVFTFAIDQSSAIDVAAAEKELRARFGNPDVDNEKILSFNLPDERAIALQRDIQNVQLWLESSHRTLPSSWEMQLYQADRGRHSNLPGRLKHNPPELLRQQGFPRPVLSVRARDRNEFTDILDWYSQMPNTLDLEALGKLKATFISHFPDLEALGFDATHGSYWDEERKYKQALIERVAEVTGRGDELSNAQVGNDVLAILESPESNLLGWRMTDRLRIVRSTATPLINEAAGALLRSPLDPPQAVEEFVQKTWPEYSEGQEGNMPYRDMRTIPTMLLAFAKPERAIGVRYKPIYTAGMRLLHRSLLKNAPFSAAEYGDVLAMSEAILNVMRDDWGWKPRDLWDVQGFIWVTCNGSDADETVSDEKSMVAESSKKSAAPTNVILYGPPGTGKTYRSAQEAVLLCDGVAPDEQDRQKLMERFNALKDAGRIAFVTFHQSYSYEDFIEGLRPETAAEDEVGQSSSGGFRLKPTDGVFKRISALAEQAGAVRPAASAFDLDGRNFFKMSLGRAYDQSEIFQAAIDGGYVALGWGGDTDWSDPIFEKFDAILEKWRSVEPDISSNRGDVTQTFRLRAMMQKGDIVIVSDGNSQFRAIGEIIGPYEFAKDATDYRHRRKVRWLRVLERSLPVETILDGKFTMMSLYRIDPKKIKRAALETILGEQGATVTTDLNKDPDPYVLVIDEINRANISKVFGELITLIEPDKRLGCLNALTVTLPYSHEEFGVPANLHIVGTMNTADRSIALLDTALRRRFQFKELMPQPSLLGDNVGGVNIRALLSALNERIEYFFDREHQIGHAYFMECRSRTDLDRVMRTKIIPLLSEYFYDNWEKLREVLGETSDEGHFTVRTKLRPPTTGAMDSDIERYRYDVRSEFPANAYDHFMS